MCRSTPRKRSSASISRGTERAGAVFAAALFFALAICWAPAVAAAVEDAYHALIYDYEVASYCGILTRQVHDAATAKRAALEAESSLTDEQLRQIRIAAFVAADREYQNRSLGGHKPWCQGEGAEGVRRILE